MAEANVSSVLMKHLRRVGHASRIENMVGRGMPDVSYCIQGFEGFIENKWRDSWPRNPEVIVTLRHFTAQQRIWIGDRVKAGGTVHVLLGVGNPIRDWLLFEGGWAVDHLGFVPRRTLIEHASIASLDTGFPWDDIHKLLISNQLD